MAKYNISDFASMTFAIMIVDDPYPPFLSSQASNFSDIEKSSLLTPASYAPNEQISAPSWVKNPHCSPSS
jgi:hypothetical protein